jgi:hypothetical protein
VPKPRGERGEVSLYGHLVFDAPIVAATPYRVHAVYAGANRAPAEPSQEGSAAAAAWTCAWASARTRRCPRRSTRTSDRSSRILQVLNLSVFETFFPEKRPVLSRGRRDVRAAVRALSTVSLAPDRPRAQDICTRLR